MRAADNPFRTEFVTALPFQPQGIVWDELWLRLEALKGRGAIVGHCGSGKTTLLNQIGEELQQRNVEVTRLNFNERERQLSRNFQPQSFGSGTALLVDGVEQLSRFDRWRLSRAKPQFFVVTSHTKTFLPLWIQTSTSPDLLTNLCHQLGVELSANEAQILWQNTRGDLREAFWKLYDQNARKKVLDLKQSIR